MTEQAPNQSPKKLYRSKTDRMVAGVCGGLAEFFGVDATIVRVIFVVVTLCGGTGLLIYIILALVVPNEPGGLTEESIRKNAEELGQSIKDSAEKLAETAKRTQPDDRRMWAGLVVLAVGILFLFTNFGFLQFSWIGKLWPLILIIMGLAIIMKKRHA